MITLKGIQKITTYKSRDVVVDWADMWFYRGRLLELQSFDRLLGVVFSTTGLGLIVVGFGYALLQGQLEALLVLGGGVANLLFWSGISLFVYSRYLQREWHDFAINREPRNLDSLQIDTSSVPIEIDSYLSVPVWGIIDRLYFTHHDDFLAAFASELRNSPQVKKVFGRLGLNSNQMDELLVAISAYNTRFDQNIALIAAAFQQALDLGSEYIDERCFVAVMLQTVWKKKLLEFGVTEADVEAMRSWLKNEIRVERYRKTWAVKSLLKPRGTVNRAFTSRYARTLEEYGSDYTREVANKGFVLSIGKDQQMRDLLKVLQKQTNAAALVVGAPGVGKTVFLKHLASRMVVEDVPARLNDRRLVAFDFNKAFTSSGKFDDFKRQLAQVFRETKNSGDIVLVLDNLDQLLNVRADLRAEIVTQLVNGVAENNLQAIATASVDGFNKFIKQEPALLNAFTAVNIPEPSAEVALQVLLDVVPQLEAKYAIAIEVAALRQIVSLAPKFSHDRVMPDKGIDLLEESLIDARDQGLKVLTPNIVSAVVSRKVGVSVGNLTKAESEVLVHIEDEMHKRVVGQTQAVSAIANALRRARAGLQQQGKPVASFLFYGPTGVGKTEVARTLAATYYGDAKLMVRFDMSEYQEEKNLGRLIGSIENGNFTGGYLTEAVRQRPFSLVLFDEIEKANPKVLDLFLQLLDEGNITDAAGRKVDFSNTIIIATSNAASAQIAEAIMQNKDYNEVYNQTYAELRKVFRVEFLNRFSKVVMFKTLSPLEVEEITSRYLQKFAADLQARGYFVEFGAKLVSELVAAGYNPVYGARELQRVVQERVEDKVAKAIITGELVTGGKLIIE